MSPAAVEPDGREPASEVPTPADLAARLKGALDRELAIGEEEPEPSRDPLGALDRDAGDVAGRRGEPDERTPVPEVRPGGRDRGDGALDLTLAPARERPAPPARAERRRERVPLVAEPRRRRSKAGSLATTIVVALVLLAAAGGGAFWLDFSGAANLGLVRDRLPAALRPAVADLSVPATEGWVSVPAGESAIAVTADGPFRVRIDGVVYSVDAGRTLRIPRQADTRVQVLAVEEGTVARVSTAR